MMARRILTLIIACLAAGCEEAPRPIAPVAISGDLVVLTVNGPATYFEDAQGLPSGLEFDLANLFAREPQGRGQVRRHRQSGRDRQEAARRAGAPRGRGAHAPLRFSRRPRLGTFVLQHPAPDRGARHARPAAQIVRRHRGQESGRDRRVGRGVPGLGADAAHAPGEAPARRGVDRRPARAGRPRPAGLRVGRIDPLHARAPLLSAARGRVQRGQARRLRLARVRGRQGTHPRRREALLRAHPQGRDPRSASSTATTATRCASPRSIRRRCSNASARSCRN